MKKKIVYIILLLSITSSCKNIKTEIESIQILYYNYNFEPTTIINCDEINDTIIPSFKRVNVYDSQNSNVVLESFIDYTGVLNATITNDTILKDIEYELLKLQPESRSGQYMDARISAKIKYKNGKENTLCIGGYNTSIICYDNIIQKTNNRLLFLIKNSIGYYKWFTEEELLQMNELRDINVSEYPFHGSYYYKKYQEAEYKRSLE